MRRLATTLALALLAPAPRPRHVDASRPARQCPAVEVSCPDTAGGGDEIKFNVSVEPAAAPAVKLGYDWQVSAGTVTSGQGTPSIKVDTTGIGGMSLRATVEVKGLPAGCGSKASCQTAVISDLVGDRFDVYGAIPFEDEKARLDSFAIELQNDPTSEGYMLCYGGRRGVAGEARRRCVRARNYLSRVRGIEPARVRIVDGGYMEKFMVWLWIVPAGATPPVPSPTVDPRDVRIIKGTRGRRGRMR